MRLVGKGVSGIRGDWFVRRLGVVEGYISIVDALAVFVSVI